MSKQEKFKTNTNWKINLQQSNNIKQEIDYFIVGQDKEADLVARAKTTWEMHDEYSDVFTGI